LWKLLAEVATREVGQNVGIPFTVEQCGEHRAATNTQHVSRDRGKLDVGAFQRLVQAVDLVGALLYQCFAIPRQLTQTLESAGQG
jgi:hypothetical protein